MIKYIILGLLAIANVALAADTTLPDPAVTLSFSQTYGTIMQTGGTAYSGPYALVLTGATCAKPDSPTYHCTIRAEDVMLYDNLGNTAHLNVTVQVASFLIRSGHNYWRTNTTVLAGTATTP